MISYAVVGSGIGGSSIAAYLNAKGHDTVLFEKEPYLGGCCSTFSNAGYHYNTGATTLAGYQEGHIVKTMFDIIGIEPDLVSTDPAITIIQNGVSVPRYRDLDRFLEALDVLHPHPKNREFWTLVHAIGHEFYGMNGYRYRAGNLCSKMGSLFSYLPLLVKFQRYLRVPAKTFIDDFFGGITEAYRDFLNAQIMIVAQADETQVNFFTAALALGYTFNETHYVPGGFSALFDTLTSQMETVKKSVEIKNIHREKEHFLLETEREIFKAENVILNSTVYDSGKLFDDPQINRYYDRYKRLDNHQSSFMLYLTVRSEAVFDHHYQIIRETPFSHTLSRALFVSFSDPQDNTIAPEGHYSVTASIHTDVRWWEDAAAYRKQKKALKEELIKTIYATLGIKEEQIVHQAAATPKTFRRYINRSQLGGNAITMKNFLPRLPGNDTPFRGLYHVGDSVYAAQGWPGVMMGVNNLRKILNV